MRTRHLLILLCLLLPRWAAAVETIVIGDVVNAATGEAIPNVSIYYQGTKIGTTTDPNGAFALRADIDRKRILVVSALGFRTERFAIEPGAMAGIQVELTEQVALLEEVLVVPGENPALPLIQAVRQHRTENDRFLLPVTTNAQQQTALYISDIQRQHLQRRLWKSLQPGMSLRPDSTMVLPLYHSTQPVMLTADDVQPLSPREEQALAISATDYRAMVQQEGNLNFYRANISLMGHSFLSPLARDGASYYRYYLTDSVSHDGGKTYRVEFKTKNPFLATFNGHLCIDSATYAVVEIAADVPQQSGVNYLRGAHIYQSFAPDRHLHTETVQFVLDFAVKTDDSHTFPTLLIEHHLHPLNPQPSTLNTQQHSTLNSQLSTTLNSQHSTLNTPQPSPLDSLPVIRVANWLAYIITTGYIPTGSYVDIGHVEELLQVSQTEGVRTGLGFRTNERVSRYVSAEAALSYGFRSREWNGLGRVQALLPAPRRHLLALEYQDRYVWPEVSDLSRSLYENGMGYHTMDFTSYALEAVYASDSARNTMVRQRQLQLHSENDWTQQLETRLYLRIGSYLAPEPFRYQTLGGLVRLGWGEKKVDRYMHRRYIHSNLPVLYLSAEMGSYNYLSEPASHTAYHLYGRLGLLLRQHVRLGQGGSLDYALSAGTVLGQVPPILLHHPAGNQGYAYDPYRFTLLNNGLFAGKQFVECHLAWNGYGVLFNRIPGIRYLRLRELLTMKMAYTETMGKEPYVEVGCGIGNIFRVLDLHSVWRLTQRNMTDSPKWAIRFRFNIDM